MTPEGKIKKKIKVVLDNYKCHNIYVYMSVPGGYGASTLDYIGCLYGRFFAIEAKRPGGKPTPRQEALIELKMRPAGAAVFVIDGDEGVALLNDWLTTVVEGNK